MATVAVALSLSPAAASLVDAATTATGAPVWRSTRRSRTTRQAGSAPRSPPDRQGRCRPAGTPSPGKQFDPASDVVGRLNLDELRMVGRHVVQNQLDDSLIGV